MKLYFVGRNENIADLIAEGLFTAEELAEVYRKHRRSETEKMTTTTENQQVEAVKRREPGFYWVKERGLWIVGKWRAYSASKGYWELSGYEDQYQDNWFEAIGERIPDHDA